MGLQHIGQDFTKQTYLNLLPGISIPRGYYQMQIQYTTDVGGIITFHHMSQNSDGKDLNVIVGRDVRSIDFQIHRHNSYPANPPISFRYNLRVDRLILLNIATRFLTKA